MDNQNQLFNKRISTPIGILIIVLFALIAGGVLAWQQGWVPREKTQDETADWKTYMNEGYGFEIKYPENWRLDQSLEYLGNTYFWGPGANLTTGVYLQIRHYSTKNDYSDINNLLNWVKIINKDDSNFIEANKTKVGNNNAIVGVYAYTSIGMKRTTYYIWNKPLIQAFDLIFSDDETGNKMRIIGEKILNTIKIFSPSGSFNALNTILDPVEQLQEVNLAKSKIIFDSIQRALYLYFQDNGKYPNDLNTLKESHYISGVEFIDPITNIPFIYLQLENGNDYKLCTSQKCVTKQDFKE